MKDDLYNIVTPINLFSTTLTFFLKIKKNAKKTKGRV